MPTKPIGNEIEKFEERNPAEVLNAIRTDASAQYRSTIPDATTDPESVKEIGAILFNYPGLKNEFVEALINRLARTIVSSKSYRNTLAEFKKGRIEFGEVIQEVFVNICDIHTFDPEVAETELYKREKPDIRSMYHILNYQKFYKNTISNDQLRTAFLSWQGITDLIAKIVEAMYTSEQNDEFLVMKYLLAKHILEGHLYAVGIPTPDPTNADTMKNIVSTIKGVSNRLEFMSTYYNFSGVLTHTVKNDQYIMLESMFDAANDVQVLASAFNMDKAQFMGHRVLIDNFSMMDMTRLNKILGDDEGYTPFTQAELQALASIPAVLVDRDWFMVFDNLQQFTEVYNAQGLYWNYMYHVWKTFSASMFANACVFVPGTPSVTSVAVDPATVTIAKGKSYQFAANVVTDKFAPVSVTWSVNSSLSAINSTGKLTIGANETATTLTVTATSTFDKTKSGTCVVTVG